MTFWDGSRWVRPPAPPAATVHRRRLRDWLATGAMIVGIALIIVPFDPADAASTLRLDPASGPPGITVTATATGLPQGISVQLTWDGSAVGMPKAKVSRQGTVSARFKVPDSAAGSHVLGLSATDRGRGRSTSTSPLPSPAAFLVMPAVVAGQPAPTPTGTLAPTALATSSPATPTASATPAPTAVATPAPPAPVATPTTPPAPIATPAPPAPAPPPPDSSAAKLIFGVGPTIDSARNARLVVEAPARMLSVWYNGPGDLAWIADAYHQTMYDTQYGLGRSIHLIVWTGDAETTLSTAYGAACGRGYPLSARFLGDMQKLAQAFAGSGTLYVTLFTEFQTFACTDNAWSPNAQTTAYWQALKDQYLVALQAFHQYAPGSRVSLGWGGWQARFDNAAIGGGRSMFTHFADVMSASDFQSFQAMQSDSNVADVRSMVGVLNDYGPVMLAHYKPNNGSTVTFDADVGAMLTDAFLTEMTNAGLFAWSFMDQANMSGSEASYQVVKAAVLRHGH